MCGCFYSQQCRGFGQVIKKKKSLFVFVSLSVHVCCVSGVGWGWVFETSTGERFFLKLRPKGLITAVLLKTLPKGSSVTNELNCFSSNASPPGTQTDLNKSKSPWLKHRNAISMQRFPVCNQHLAVWALPLLNLQLAQLMHCMPNHLFSYYILMFAFNNKFPSLD